MMLRLRLSAAILLAFSALAVEGQTKAATSSPVLQARLNQIAASFPGVVGVFVRNLDTGVEAGINAGQSFPMASTYKVAIMTQVFRQVDAGKISLDERIPLTEKEMRPGSGLLRYMTPGLNPTIHDLMLMMITVSDNEATDILLNRVGAANVTAMLRQFGIQDMRVDRTTLEIIGDWMAAADPSLKGESPEKMLQRPERVENLTPEQMDNAGMALTNDPRDHTSPRAMADLLALISNSQAASEKSCKAMLAIMRNQQLIERIPRYLENISIASKSGTIGRTTNDVGIIEDGKQRIVVSVYTLKANSAVTTEQAQEVIARLARATYDYFQDVSPAP